MNIGKVVIESLGIFRELYFNSQNKMNDIEVDVRIKSKMNNAVQAMLIYIMSITHT